jgi:nitroreductase
MNIKNQTFETISNRHCKRAYLNKSVDQKVLKSIIDIACNAASSKNTQPWKVEIVLDQKLETLKKKMCEKFDNSDFDQPDYLYSPNPLSDIHMDRARKCGYELFSLKNIDRKDREKRTAHDRENFECFGAPALLIFTLEQDSEKGTFLDLGLYMQNIMLACTSLGLGSCPQYSLTNVSSTIKKELQIAPSEIIICGLSLGYPDESAIVNSFIPERINSDKYTTWHQ